MGAEHVKKQRHQVIADQTKKQGIRWVQLLPPLPCAISCCPQHTVLKPCSFKLKPPAAHCHFSAPPPPRYVDTCSASGFTALHFAVACNCVPAILALLAYDAHIDDFNIFDAGEFWISCATKSTPLHIAAISNRLQCAVAILQYFVSADVNG